MQAVWCRAQPAQLGTRRLFACQHAQFPHRAFKARCEPLPIGQALRQSKASGQDVAGHIQGLVGAQKPPEKLHANFVQLMGFIKHHRIDRGQQLRHAGFPHGDVSKKQVVVDDHHIRAQRLPPGQVDVACLELRALGAQAVLPG